MWNVFGYIFRTAKREAGLMTFLKFLGIAALPSGWKVLANYFCWDAVNPSALTTFLSTGIIVAVGLLFVIAKNAKELEEPKFELSLPYKGLSQTPVSSPAGSGTANYIRLCVETTSGVAVKNCSASIVGIEKRKPEDSDFIKLDFTDRVELEWSHSNHTKVIVLNPLEPMYIAIARASTLDNSLRFETPQDLPNKYGDFLSDNAVYRFKVRVTGDGVSKLISIDVDWKGNWDTISVSEEPYVAR